MAGDSDQLQQGPGKQIQIAAHAGIAAAIAAEHAHLFKAGIGRSHRLKAAIGCGR